MLDSRQLVTEAGGTIPRLASVAGVAQAPQTGQVFTYLRVRDAECVAELTARHLDDALTQNGLKVA